MEQAAAVAETHSAAVFFLGDRAYKVKKPVDLGFLDFRTREARERACHREVALNRRFAPDVYLGVADVHGPDGRVVDHLVVMRRMPHDRRLSALVTADADAPGHVRSVARAVATLHADAPRSSAADEAAAPAAVAANWDSNFRGLDPYVDGLLPASAVGRARQLAGRYLEGRSALLEDRVARGLAREGHGDLLADDIFLLPDGPRILDCLDFDDRFRCGDVLLDAAFLAMDLERLGHLDLADAFLHRWSELLGEAHPRSLAHHYVAYRSLVRSKVACVRAEQGDAASQHPARALLDMCVRHLDAGRVRLVLVGGLPGTGKSTLAAALADDLGSVLLRSDVIRKQLVGVDPTVPAPAPVGEGLYEPHRTALTYRTLLEQAAAALGRGESVVLDATWSRQRWRAEATAVADAAAADLVQLRCEAPTELTRRRLATRAVEGSDASDADQAVADAMARAADPWPTAVGVDTGLRPEQSVALARRAVLAAP